MCSNNLISIFETLRAQYNSGHFESECKYTKERDRVKEKIHPQERTTKNKMITLEIDRILRNAE